MQGAHVMVRFNQAAMAVRFLVGRGLGSKAEWHTREGFAQGADDYKEDGEESEMEIEDLITRLEQAVDTGEVIAYTTEGGWQESWVDLCKDALIAIRGMQKLMPVNRTFDNHKKLYHGWVTCVRTTDIVDGVQFERGEKYEGELHTHGGGTAFSNKRWLVWDKHGVHVRTFSVVEFQRDFLKGELAKELPDEQ